jgi:VanZ family protein
MISKKSLYIYWFPVVVYGAIIFYLSSRPALHISHDKTAHLFEYAILGFFISRGLLRSFSSNLKWIVILALVFSAFYGATDEFHQYFVPGRDCSGWDLLVDVMGSFIGVSVYVFFHQLQRVQSAN